MFQSDQVKSNLPVLDTTRLPPDEVQVFAIRIGEIALHDDALLAMLSEDERQRAGQFQFDRPRRQFAVTRAALRSLLGRTLDVPTVQVELIADASGKPHLGSAHTSSRLRFNVAHSGDIALIAVAAGCDVGIDVEAVRRVAHLERIARRYFHAAESDAIYALSPCERSKAFLRCWTCKEAVVKSLGTGLAESLSSFCVPVANFDGTWIDVPALKAAPSARVWLQPIAIDAGYLAAMACVGERRRAHSFAFRW